MTAPLAHANPAPVPSDGLFPGANLAGRDLSGQSLRGRDLSGVNLRGAKLCACDLSGAELMGADLTGADLRDATLVRTGLAMTTLDGAQCTQANFTEASLTKASLRGIDADLACFDGARLMDANLCEGSFNTASFVGSTLLNCDIHRASFRDSAFDNAKIRGLRNFGSSTWVHADLRTADLSSAQLLARHASDQNFLWEFRRRSRTSEALYALWWVTSDCGRSFTRWGLITALLAVCFAGLYRVVGVDFGANETVLSPLYFSVVTLTTLGYGDILPTTMAGQIAVMVETVLGYVMLGGLLAMFSSTVARRS